MQLLLPAILLAFALILALASGCTSAPQGPGPAASTPPGTTVPVPATPAATTVTLPSPAGGLPGSPGTGAACTADTDCVPAQCCHPTGCINPSQKHVCTLMCTDVCQGPIDCGAGHCGCSAGTCAILPGPAR